MRIPVCNYSHVHSSAGAARRACGGCDKKIRTPSDIGHDSIRQIVATTIEACQAGIARVDTRCEIIWRSALLERFTTGLQSSKDALGPRGARTLRKPHVCWSVTSTTGKTWAQPRIATAQI